MHIIKMLNIFKKKKEEQLSIDKNVDYVDKQKEEVAPAYITEIPTETKKEQTNYKKPIDEIERKIEDKRIIDALKNVKDPELDIDIWSLELIYDIDIRDKNIDIKMTFTSPFCPYGPELIRQVKDRLNGLMYETKIELVFSPPWNPSEQVKEILGII